MPWEPLVLGLKFNIRIADLEATDFMERVCPQCREITRLATWQLHALFPRHRRLVDLEREMRCRKCGYRGKQAWCLWRAHPPVRIVEERRKFGGGDVSG